MMTLEEIMKELASNSPLNRARREFSSAIGRIEQAQGQRKPIGPIEVRRLEFEAVQKIVNAYNWKP